MGVPNEAPSLPSLRRAPASCVGRRMALLGLSDVERRSPPGPLRRIRGSQPVVRTREPAAPPHDDPSQEGSGVTDVKNRSRCPNPKPAAALAHAQQGQAALPV